MKTKTEIRDWLLENCVGKNGRLDLSHLDFSDFDGEIDTSFMKVKSNLFQCHQNVDGCIFQSDQKVGKSLYQHHQKVEGHLFQE